MEIMEIIENIENEKPDEIVFQQHKIPCYRISKNGKKKAFFQYTHDGYRFARITGFPVKIRIVQYAQECRKTFKRLPKNFRVISGSQYGKEIGVSHTTAKKRLQESENATQISRCKFLVSSNPRIHRLAVKIKRELEERQRRQKYKCISVGSVFSAIKKLRENAENEKFLPFYGNLVKELKIPSNTIEFMEELGLLKKVQLDFALTRAVIVYAPKNSP